jgi:adenylate cyclase
MMHVMSTTHPGSRVSEHYERRIPFLLRMLSLLVPSSLLGLYVWLTGGDDIYTRAELAAATTSFLVTFLGMSSINVALNRRRFRGVFETLRALEARRDVRPEDLHDARLNALRAPWRLAGTLLLSWSVVYPSAMALGVWMTSGTLRLGLLLSGLLLGPFIGLITLLVTEILLRPGIPLLFPAGGIKDFQGRWNLTLRKRMVLSLLLMGPVMLLGTSILTLGVVHDSTGILDAQRRLWPMLLYALVMSAALFAALLLLSMNGFLRPILRIEEAMDAIADGNLEVRIPIETGDVLGILGEHLNAMVTKLQERFHLESAFGRFVDPSLASQAARGDLHLAGRHQTVAVMFTDIRNFTTLSESQDPGILVDQLNRYFSTMLPCITGHGGTLNKFLGDGMMVLFGAPGPLDRPSRAALLAARDLMRALEQFNVLQRERDLPELAMGIGIATGQVVVGTIGAASRMEFTAIGDTVNLASRLEGLTKQMGSVVLLDATTAATAGDDFDLVSLGAVLVKGKTIAEEVHAPRWARTAVSGSPTEPL